MPMTYAAALGTGRIMPWSQQPVICGVSPKTFSQKDEDPIARTRRPAACASIHWAILYWLVQVMSRGRMAPRATFRYWTIAAAHSAMTTACAATLVQLRLRASEYNETATAVLVAR